MAILLADIGGSQARFGWLENGKMGSIFQLKCDNFKTVYDAIGSFIKKYPQKLTGIVLAGAGPFKKNSLEWTNRPQWSVSQKELQKKYRIKKVLIVNDVFAQAEGLRSFYKIKKTVLLTAGTGLGSCLIVDDNLMPMEIGQVKTDCGKIEDFISGGGIVHLYHLSGGDKKIKSAIRIDELRPKKDKAAQKAYQTFYQKWGILCGRLTTMLYLEKGIYLWGNLLPKNEKDKKVLLDAYRKVLPNDLKKTPLHFVKDKSLAFKGLALLSAREFGQS